MAEWGLSDPISNTPAAVGWGVNDPLSTQSVAPPVTEEAPLYALPSGFEAGKYTEDDLLNPEAQAIMRDSMATLYGDHFYEMEGRELVESFLNTNRGVASGNIWRGGRELFAMNGKDAEGMRKIGQGYFLFENMANIFSGETTALEKLEGVQDYVREAILDPINLVGLGLGKIVGSGVGRTTTAAARATAMAEVRRVAASGATREVAEQAGSKLFRAANTELREQTLREIAERATVEGARRASAAEFKTVLAFDTAVAIGGQLLYQETRMRTDVRTEYSWADAGLAALGVLAVGGVFAGLNALKGSSGLTPLTRSQPTSLGRAARKVAEQLENPNAANNSWDAKVFRGLKGAENLSRQFWPKFMFGDSKAGFTGFYQHMVAEGYSNPREPGMRVADWIGEVLRDIPDKDFDALMTSAAKSLGISKKKLVGIGADGKVIDATTKDNFIDIISAQASQAGSLLGSYGNLGFVGDQLSKAAKNKNKALEDLTVGDMADVFAPNLGLNAKEVFAEVSKKAVRFQSNTIRMLVSALPTTALNVQGYLAGSGITTMSEIGMYALYSGKSGINRLLGNINSAEAATKEAQLTAQALKQSFRNLIDHNTTHDTFMSMAVARPKMFQELTATLAGGVDNRISAQLALGFDPRMTRAELGVEKFVDIAGQLALVQVQDIMTKSQSYAYWIDKAIRRNFGVDRGLADLAKTPDELLKFMNSKEFAEGHAKAIYETTRSVFSTSFKDPTTSVGKLAGLVEDLRNFPGIGLLVPFGRFFNNTIATLADASGLGLAYKLTGGYENRTFEELLLRGAVGVAAITAIMPSDRENLESGLAWDEDIDVTSGEVLSVRYAFPYSLYKAAARLAIHHTSGTEMDPAEKEDLVRYVDETKRVIEAFKIGEVPQGVSEQMMKNVFGQLTRDLASAGEGLVDTVASVLNGDTSVFDGAVGLLVQPVPTVVNAWTRSLEPLNYAMALARGTDFVEMDRKQGNEMINNSFRYVDQFMAALGITDPQQRYTAAGGVTTFDPGRLIGNRPGTSSATERVMNVIGKETFTLNEFTANPEGSNRFNSLLHSLIEEKSKTLLTNDRFRGGDYRTRVDMFNNMAREARDQVRSLMEAQVLRSGDALLIKSMKILKGHSAMLIEKAMEDTGLSEFEYTDLTLPQLELLEMYLKHREDVIQLYGN